MKFKKSQGALELIILLVFIFFVISGVMYVVGLYSIQVSKTEVELDRDDYANSLLAEAVVLQDLQEIYTREVRISGAYDKYYNVTVEGDYLIFQDPIYDGVSSSKRYYYEIPGNHTVLFEKRPDLDGDGLPDKYIIFIKNRIR